MQIEKLVVGALQENCYIVTINDSSMIIDPGDEADRIIEACSNKKVVEILVTHHHFDHVGALETLEKTFNIKHNTKSDLFDYEIIKTPGHSNDSICFYFEEYKTLFSGDFIFLGTIGRTDLPTGSDYDMQESLEKISTYPDDIKVFPGHGESTVLEAEKKRFKWYY